MTRYHPEGVGYADPPLPGHTAPSYEDAKDQGHTELSTCGSNDDLSLLSQNGFHHLMELFPSQSNKLKASPSSSRHQIILENDSGGQRNRLCLVPQHNQDTVDELGALDEVTHEDLIRLLVHETSAALARSCEKPGCLHDLFQEPVKTA